MPADILIVDDEAPIRELMGRALAAMGHSVRLAEDGSQALGLLAAQPADLLVADIVMPGLDGISLSLAVAKRWPRTKILLISGYPAERARAVNLESFVGGVLSKPFGLPELRAAIEAVLAGRPVEGGL